MKKRFLRNQQKRYALWDDVVEATDGKPYGCIHTYCPEIANSTITRAKTRGYFSSSVSEVLYRMTNKRLRLTNYGSIKPSHWEYSTNKQTG